MDPTGAANNTDETHKTDPIDPSDESGFDDGFNSDPRSPTATPGSGDATAVEAVEGVEAVEYARLTLAELAELKTRVAGIDELRATQDKSFGTAFGKLGGLERRLSEIAAAPGVEIEQADIDALKDDFPPLAAALEKVRAMRTFNAGGFDAASLDERVQSQVSQAMAGIDATVEQVVEKRLLAREHPDWDEVTHSTAFLDWAGKQPVAYQQTLGNSWDSAFVGQAIAAFKQSAAAAAAAAAAPSQSSRQDPADARRSRMRASAMPPSSGGGPTSDANSDFDAGFKTG